MSIQLIKKHKYTLILMGIILSSSFLIFGGNNWGLPLLLHPDEPVIVDAALRMIQNRTLLPDVFYRPDHLLIIANSFLFRVIFKLYNILGNSGNPGTEIFYIASRTLTGLFAVGSIVISYLIGKKHSNLTGIACAFAFAFYPRFITHAHYITPDVPTVFFMLLFIYTALIYMQKPGYKNLALMSLATAGFITIKYPGAICCLMIAVTVIVSSLTLKDKKLIVKRIITHGALAILFVLVFTFIISPVLFLEFDKTIDALIAEANHNFVGEKTLGFGGNMLYYLEQYISKSGIILLIFFFFGCYAVFSRKQDGIAANQNSIPLFYSLIYWVCLSVIPLHVGRWGLPMYVSPLLISAIGVSKASEIIGESEWLAERQKPKLVLKSVFVLCICLSALNIAISAYNSFADFLLKDTRIASRQYTDENGITADNSVFEAYTTLNPGGGDFPSTIFHAFEEIDGVYYLKDRQIENIIISSDIYSRYKKASEEFTKEAALYDSLEKHYTETQRFSEATGSDMEISFSIGFITDELVEVTNIWNNAVSIIDKSSHGVTGFTLIFYKAGPHNYIP